MGRDGGVGLTITRYFDTSHIFELLDFWTDKPFDINFYYDFNYRAWVFEIKGEGIDA